MYHGLVSNAKPITLGKGPLADAAAANLAPMFAALSDPIRLRLFDLVRRAGRDGICSCDLTEPRTLPPMCGETTLEIVRILIMPSRRFAAFATSWGAARAASTIA